MATKMLQVVISGDVKGALAGFAELDAGAGKVESSIGSKFAKVGMLVGVGIAAGAVAAGAALFKIGETFDEQYDKIRVGTGATGSRLDELKASFKDVVQDVPTDFDSAGTAITTLVQKLGAGPAAVKPLAEQFLELSRITKTDLAGNLAAGTDALNNWNIPAAKQSATLDKMFRATQISGLGFADLSAQLSDAGVVLRAAGLGFDESIGLVAALGKAGISTADVMPALGKSLATAAKDGKPAADVLRDTLEQIKNAPDDTAAAGVAMDVFGAKAGPKFAQLVREGKLNYQDFTNTILDGNDTIIGAGKETQDFGEKWEMFKNKVLVVLEPLATRVFNAIGEAMDALPGIIADVRAAGDDIVKWVDSLGIKWGEIWQGIQDTTKTVVDWITNTGWPALQTAFAEVESWAEHLATFVTERWDKIKEAVTNVVTGLLIVFSPMIVAWKAVWDHIGEIFRVAWDYISGIVRAGVDIVKGIIDVVLGLLTLDFGQAWDGIKEIFGGAWDAITQIVSTGIDTVKLILSIAWEAIGMLVAGAWEGIKGTVTGGIDAVVGFVSSLPGRILAFEGELLGAGLALGGAIIGGLENGITGAADAIAGVASAVFGAFKSGWNVAAGTINDFIPDRVGFDTPFGFVGVDLPNNPLPTFHTGGVVPGRPGEEMLAVLQGGERVLTAAQQRAGGGGGASTLVIPVSIGGTKLTEIVVRDLNRTGGPKLSQRAISG